MTGHRFLDAPGTSTGGVREPLQPTPDPRGSGRRRVAAAAAISAVLAAGATALVAALLDGDDERALPPVAAPLAREAPNPPQVRREFDRRADLARREKATATLTRSRSGRLLLRVDVSAPDTSYVIRFKVKGGRPSLPIQRGRHEGHITLPTSRAVLGRKYDYLDVMVRHRGKVRTTMRLNTGDFVGELPRG